MYTERHFQDWQSVQLDSDDKGQMSVVARADDPATQVLGQVLQKLSPNLQTCLARAGDGGAFYKCRALPFYRLPESGHAPQLVGLRVDPDKLTTWMREVGAETRIESSAVWFLVAAGQPESLIFALNGTSPPIHEFNARLGGIRIDDASAVNEYLDFFCSFVHGEDGPFEIIIDETDVRWANWKAGTVDERSEIDRRVRRIFKDAFKDAPKDEPGSDSRSHTFSATKARVQEALRTHRGIRAPTDSDAELFANPEAIRQALSTPADPKEPPSALRVALVMYSAVPFLAFFKVLQTGMIEMIQDKQLVTTGSLPIGASRFEDKFGRETVVPAVLVGLEPPRDPAEREVTSLKALLEPARLPPLAAAVGMVIRNEHASGDEDRRSEHAAAAGRPTPDGDIADKTSQAAGDTTDDIQIIDRFVTTPVSEREAMFSRSIRFRNVVFYEDVVLSGSTFEQSVEFVECTFMKRLIADNIIVKGQLTLDRCSIRALDPELDDLYVAFDLESARVDRSVVISRCRIDGMLSMRGIQIGARCQIFSTDVRPRIHIVEGASDADKDDKGERPRIYFAQSGEKSRITPAAIDLRDSRIGVGLDIGQFKPTIESLRKEEYSPTLVIGAVRAEDMRVDGPFNLFGLITTGFNRQLIDPSLATSGVMSGDVLLTDARIEGGVRVWRASDHATNPWHAGENVIGGDFRLTGARVRGDLDLRGMWIEQDLSVARGEFKNLFLSSMGSNTSRHDVSWIDVVNRGEDGPVSLYAIPPELIIRDTSKHRLWRNGRTYIGGVLSLEEARFSGSVDLAGLYCGGEVRGRGADIAGRVNAGLRVEPLSFEIYDWDRNSTQAEASLDIRLFGEQTEQHKWLLGMADNCEFLPTASDTVHKPRGEGEDRRYSDTCEGLHISRFVARRLVFRDAQIGGSMDLSGAKIGLDADRAGVEIENCRIGGSVNCSDASCERMLENMRLLESNGNSVLNGLLDPEGAEGDEATSNHNAKKWLRAHLAHDGSRPSRLALECSGDFRIHNSSIDSYLDLTGMTCGGSVSLGDVKLNGDLRAFCCQTEIDARCEVSPILAHADSIRLNSVRCDGDIQIPGIALRSELAGDNLVVAGNTALVSTSPVKDRRGGHQRLSAQKITLEGSVFHGLRLDPTNECDLSLERARVRLLELDSMPASVNLKAAQIDFWTLSDKQNGDHVALLRRVKPFSSDAFSSIEGLLRRQGQPQQADRVYKRMIRRETQRQIAHRYISVLNSIKSGSPAIFSNLLGAITSTLWGGLKLGLYGVFTGFGTGRGRLFVMCLALFMCAYALASASGNRKQDSGEQCASALIMASKIAIPVVAFATDLAMEDKDAAPPQRVLRDDGNTQFAWGCALPLGDQARTDIEDASPDQIAFLLSMIGWVIWPLFILTLSGVIRRTDSAN